MPSLGMDNATERRILYALCLMVLALGLFDLNQSLNQANTQAIGVSVLLIGISIGTSVAVWRSGGAPTEIDEE